MRLRLQVVADDGRTLYETEAGVAASASWTAAPGHPIICDGQTLAGFTLDSWPVSPPLPPLPAGSLRPAPLDEADLDDEWDDDDDSMLEEPQGLVIPKG